MKITKDSPILTNYLLNEVTQAERQAVEAAVQSDPEVRDALASLKSVIQLAEGLKANHRTERLTQEQREKILSLGEAASDTKRIFSLNWIKWSGGLLTASLALMILTNTKNQLEHKTQSLEVSIPTAEAPADVTTVAKKYATHFKSNASMLSGPSAKGKKEVPAKSEEPDVFAEQSSAKRSAEQRPDLNLRGTSGPDAIAASPADLIAEPSRSSGLKKYLSFGGVGGGSNPAAFSSGKALSKSGAPSAVASPADSAKEREEEIETSKSKSK